jgi:hypothetical protein
MSLVSSSIPNLLNGISQQPSSLRQPSQAEVQINGLSSVTRGLEKRPCSEHISKLAGVSTATNSFIHPIKYSSTEDYTALFTSSGIKVFDSVGVAKTVKDDAGVVLSGLPSYLTGVTDFNTQISAVSVGDSTFIVNKNKTVAMDTYTATARPPECMFYIRQADYGLTYTVSVGSTTATYTTPDGSASAHTAEIATDYIATQLYNSLSLSAAYTKELIGSVVYVKRTDGSDFEITSSDGAGDRYMFSFKGQTIDFKNLPRKGKEGFKILVSGSNEKKQDDHYVHLTKNTNNHNELIWKETVGDTAEDGTALKNRIDKLTMPHRLIKNVDGSFTFTPITWNDRKAGDEETNPKPSYVGFKINDIFFHRNRLGFLADENVIFSEAGEFYNFFPKTVLTTLDSNPIDVAVSNNQISILKHAIPFNESLLIFSDLTQFMLTASELLTPDTVHIDVSTNFEADLVAKPVGAGRYVFFGYSKGKWSGMREYYVESSSETNDAADISAHTPTFLEGTITGLAASSNEDMLLVLCEDKPNSVFVYRYYWRGEEKLQSAWSEWVFSGEVKSVAFNGSSIKCVCEYSDGLYLESLSLSNDSASEYMTYTATLSNYGGGAVLLDRRFILTASGVPYTDPNTIFVDTDGVKVSSTTAASKVVSGERIYGGVPYTFTYQFSEPVLKQDNKAITIAKLQIRNFNIVYNDTAYFKVESTPTERPTVSREFNGRTIGGGTNILGRANLDEGTYRVPIMTNSKYAKIVLTSDSYLPCVFQSAEWEGYVTQKTQRI